MQAMGECFSNNFILNGVLQPSELFEDSLVYEGESVYEVLRMVRGLPVFFNDHIERLESSVRLQKRGMLSNGSAIRADILLLSHSEKMQETNLKIVFNYGSRGDNYLIYYIKPIYPTVFQYENGVRGILFHAERNDPGAKVINHRLRSEIYHKLILENAYEALLVNKNGCITEGSRSNIFFIRGSVLYTAPGNAVLSGITRKHLLEICRENEIQVEFTCLNASEISDFESAVMTGTSPVVLPFNSIGSVKFNVRHHLISYLRILYLERAEESLREFM